MTRRCPTLLAIAAMLLSAAPRALAASEPMFGRLCAAHPASLPLPLRKRDRECPDACHAVCARARGECEEDSGE